MLSVYPELKVACARAQSISEKVIPLKLLRKFVQLLCTRYTRIYTKVCHKCHIYRISYTKELSNLNKALKDK